MTRWFSAGFWSEPHPAGVGLVLLALSAAVYSPVFLSGFVYDDHMQIENNPWIRSPANLPEFFRHSTRFFQGAPDAPGPGQYYRPLHMAAYALIHVFSGTHPLGYHLANLFLHAVCAWLLFGLARTWADPPGAWAAAVAFVLLPVHVEAVAWAAAIPELLSAALVLALLRLHLKPLWQPHHYLLGTLYFGAALLSRENALIFPLLAGAHDLLTRRRWEKESDASWRSRYGLYALLTAVWLTARSHVLGYWFSPPGMAFPLGFLEIGLTGIWLLFQYFLYLLPGLPLSAFHVLDPVTSLFTPRWWLAVAGLGLVALAGKQLWRVQPWLAFALAWIPVTLLPFLYLPALGDNALNERYLYLPSAGACLLLGAGIAAWWRRAQAPRARAAVALACALAAIVGSGLTLSRAFDWQDDIRIFTRTLKSDPTAHHVLDLLGSAYFAANRPHEALKTYARIDRWFPGQLAAGETVTPAKVAQLSQEHLAYRVPYFQIQRKRAALLHRLDRLPEAMNLYIQLLEIFPQDAELHANLGLTALSARDRPTALRALRTALHLNPKHEAAAAALHQIRSPQAERVSELCEQARGLIEKKDYAQARRLLEQAERLDPEDPKPPHYLFNLHWLMGNKVKAAAAMERAFRLDPNNPLFQYNMRQLQPPSRSPGAPAQAPGDWNQP